MMRELIWNWHCVNSIFTNAEDVEFTVDNTYPEDSFVSRLYLINREFIKHFKERNFKKQQLIPLTNILKEKNP